MIRFRTISLARVPQKSCPSHYTCQLVPLLVMLTLISSPDFSFMMDKYLWRDHLKLYLKIPFLITHSTTNSCICVQNQVSLFNQCWFLLASRGQICTGQPFCGSFVDGIQMSVEWLVLNFKFPCNSEIQCFYEHFSGREASYVSQKLIIFCYFFYL